MEMLVIDSEKDCYFVAAASMIVIISVWPGLYANVEIQVRHQLRHGIERMLRSLYIPICWSF